MKIWGDPVEFKGINIYPIRMKDCTVFYENVSCLMYEKNKIQDVRVIKMSYLDFIFALMREDEEIYKRLDYILKLSLQDQRHEFLYSDDGNIFLQIDDVVFTGFEFEKIQKYILDENMIRVNDQILDPILEKKLMEAEEHLAKQNGIPATLEERIVGLHCVSHDSYKDIKDYTIYQFNKSLERFSLIKNFDTYSALMAENGASKDVVHWLAHISEKGIYEDVSMPREEFNKISDMLTGNTVESK